MAHLWLPKRHTFKPPVGAQINWGHPLAIGLTHLWLLNEAGGSQVNDLVGQPQSTTFNSSPAWIAGKSGAAVQFPSSAWINLNSAISSIDSTKPFAIAFRAYIGTFSATQRLMFSLKNSGTSNPFIGDMFSDANYGDLTLGLLSNATNVRISFPSGPAGLWWDMVINNDGSGTTTTGPYEVYINGKAVSVNSAPSLGAGANANNLGGYNNASTINFNNGAYEWFAVYNRMLKPSEAQRLYIDPYGMLLPQSPRIRYFPPAVAVTGGGFLVNGGLLGTGRGLVLNV